MIRSDAQRIRVIQRRLKKLHEMLARSQLAVRYYAEQIDLGLQAIDRIEWEAAGKVWPTADEASFPTLDRIIKAETNRGRRP